MLDLLIIVVLRSLEVPLLVLIVTLVVITTIVKVMVYFLGGTLVSFVTKWVFERLWPQLSIEVMSLNRLTRFLERRHVAILFVIMSIPMVPYVPTVATLAFKSARGRGKIWLVVISGVTRTLLTVLLVYRLPEIL